MFQISLILLLPRAAYPQHRDSLPAPIPVQEAVKNRPQKLGLTGYFGFAAGKESFLSIMPPKFGVLAYAALNSNEPISHFSFPRKAVYAGMDVGAGVLVASYTLGAVFLGVKYRHFTFDNSLAVRSSFTNPGAGVKKNLVTCNPKIGFQYRQCWLKAGPSFVVKGGLARTRQIRLGNTYFNTDFNYLIKGKKK